MKLINSKNYYYKRALQVEINLGTEGNSAPEKYPPTIDLHPAIIKYRNFKITGKESYELYFWIDSLFRERSPLAHGLTLGSGTGKEAIYMQERGFVKQWDSIDIVETFGNKLKNKEDNTFSCSDLNFIELPKEKYNIVICFGVLHHIVNIEELLFEVNKSLKSDGVLLVCEYVGESKWNFTSLKRTIIEKALENKFNYKFSYNKRDMSLRPLESIRSEEIPEILDFYFKESKLFEFIWNPILYPGINIASQINNKPINAEFIDEQIRMLVELNELNEGNTNLLKTEIIGLYKKNSNLISPIIAIPWSNKEIKRNLNSWGYTKSKYKTAIMRILPKSLIKYYRKVYGRS